MPEPKASGRSPEYERLRRVLIPLAGLAMVLFAVGLGAFVLRPDDEGVPDSGSDTAGPLTTTATAEANPTTAMASIAAPSTAVSASTVASTAAAASIGTPVATTAAPATPAATTVASATSVAPAPATTAPTTAAGDPSSSAVATAQALLDALADGRWNDARVLNPGRDESDAFLQSQYGPLEQATIVPARITPEPNGLFDLRFGIVAHEAQPTGPQTVLLCSHWQVDVPTRTIERISSTRLRVEGGYVAAGPVAAELSSTCQAVPAT